MLIERDLKRAALAANTPDPVFIGANSQLTTLLATVDRAAACEGKVLITGESGVGKDLIARRIHAREAASANVEDLSALRARRNAQ